LNPVLAGPERVLVRDARVVLWPPDLPAEKRARPVIRPYPNQYTAPFRLADGTVVLVRAVRPEDEPLIIEFHASHSARTIRLRFFGMVKALSRNSLNHLCHLDYDRAMGLVAEHRDADGRPYLCGVSRYYLDTETRTAEFAVVVGDAWQGRGLGSHLMRRLIAVAREHGVRRLVGEVLRDNEGMIRLVEGLGFTLEPTEDSAVLKATLPLDASDQ
jgi:acetyltransferase